MAGLIYATLAAQATISQDPQTKALLSKMVEDMSRLQMIGLVQKRPYLKLTWELAEDFSGAIGDQMFLEAAEKLKSGRRIDVTL